MSSTELAKDLYSRAVDFEVPLHKREGLGEGHGTSACHFSQTIAHVLREGLDVYRL